MKILPFLKISLLVLCLLSASAIRAADSSTVAPQPTSLSYPNKGETPEIIGHLSCVVVMDVPVGGIISIALPSLTRHLIRRVDEGLSAVYWVSEASDSGEVAFVTSRKGIFKKNMRSFEVRMIDREGERILFSGPGDALWDRAISAISLAHNGNRLAFILQPVGAPNFSHLRNGRLAIWERSTGQIQDFGILAAGERPVWLPDGRHLIYVGVTNAPELEEIDIDEPTVHLLDTETLEDKILTKGHLPTASTDGTSVAVIRGVTKNIFIVNIASKAEQSVPMIEGLKSIVAFIDGRYLLYTGTPTPGMPVGTTKYNSTGPKSMLALKVMDLRTFKFATLTTLIDPRSTISASGASYP